MTVYATHQTANHDTSIKVMEHPYDEDLIQVDIEGGDNWICTLDLDPETAWKIANELRHEAREVAPELIDALEEGAQR